MQKIFDAHLHLWDLGKIPISWIKDDEKLEQNYDFFRMKQEYKEFEFIGAMYVEVNSDDLEKEALFALEQKKLHNLLFCLADFKHKEELSSFREVMHTSKKGAKRLFEADFEEKIEILKTFNIPFEACMKNEELSFLENFLNKNSNLKVVLNHLGSPKINRLNEYKKDLNLLKKFPNLYIKLSTPDDFSQETPKEFIFELFAFLKENFSEDKFIFGSNYPVSNLSPKQWIELIMQSKVFKDLDLIFYKNALSIYKGERMQRYGQIIKIKKEKIQKYKNLHAKPYEGVCQMIKECNIQNYSIYLFGEYLFAYFEYVGADFEADMAKMARDENTQKWWKVTDPCQISLGYAGQKWLNMEEVFHLD